jgi:hypothetical protein
MLGGRLPGMLCARLAGTLPGPDAARLAARGRGGREAPSAELRGAGGRLLARAGGEKGAGCEGGSAELASVWGDGSAEPASV